MSKRASPGLIGAFVVGSVVVLIAAILAFGSGRFLEKRQRFVIFFDEAVTGLSVGSPVILRGVEIGNVAEIKAVIDGETLEIELPVYIEIREGQVEVIGERPGALAGVRGLVERGMRAQLGLQSLVTGNLYVSLVAAPDKPIVYAGKDPSTPEIPSILSELADAKRTLEDLPLAKLVQSALSTVEGADALVNGPELKSAVTNLAQALTEARDLIASANEARLVADMDAAIKQLRASLGSAETAMANLDAGLASGSPLQYQIQQTLEELRRAARGVATLSEQLSREPDSLIRGRRGGG